MPREIEELSPAKPRGNSKYDWNDFIVEGRALAFTHGTDDEVEAGTADFSCKPSSFEVMARSEAAERGLSLKVRKPDESTVEILPYVKAQTDDEGDDA